MNSWENKKPLKKIGNLAVCGGKRADPPPPCLSTTSEVPIKWESINQLEKESETVENGEKGWRLGPSQSTPRWTSCWLEPLWGAELPLPEENPK